ncbi:hypothetical protein J1614_011074 [Plenodomus biglobosus]|nr:hypothetical protein J1614_011074 [Plenodomus biglobosus]
MRTKIKLLALLCLLPLSFAAPAPAPAPLPQLVVPQVTSRLQERQSLGEILRDLFNDAVEAINAAVAAGSRDAVRYALFNLRRRTRPRDIQEIMENQSAVWASHGTRTDFYAAVASQVANGIVRNNTFKVALTSGLHVGEDSDQSDNPPPLTSIYPKKDPADAPYTLSEAALRKAIYIPTGFTFGVKPPVLFIPGTGSYGGSNFGPNLRKLLTGKDYADPVWLNIPDALLGDAQINSEYIAYAIQYLSSVTRSRNLSIITWSQGGLDTQWVLKYWPSTRSLVRNFLAISPDFKGTTLANALCLGFHSDHPSIIPLCPPSVLQQQATSQFIAALRRNNGSSAYVPTTTFYTNFLDEVVQPQQGPAASAILLDTRGVGVANIELQTVCAGLRGAVFYGHAGALFHPLTHALVVDVLTHGGPADLTRINIIHACAEFTARELGFDDVVATAGLIPVAAARLLTAGERLRFEPEVREYAR